jgi:hypothetical protein
MMLGGLVARPWNAGALVVYCVFWLGLLIWTWNLGHRMSHVLPVMWASLNCGRPAHAVWRTSGFKGWWVWVWIWNLSNFRNLGGGLQGFPSGSRLQMVFVITCGLLLLTVWLIRRRFPDHGQVDEFKWDPQAKGWLSMRSPFKNSTGLYGKRLIGEFREIVREPLPDPSDPRFKKWNVLERFPWGSTKVDLAHQRNLSPGEEDAKIAELAKSGDKIGAVKLTRQIYGSTLNEAVAFVEKLRSGG